MAWVVTNGRQYIKKDANGNAVCTSKLHHAVRFDDYRKANNYCNCLPKTMKNLGFYATTVSAPAEAPSVDIPSAPQNKEIEPVVAAKTSVHDLPGTEINESLLDFEVFTSKIQDFSEFVSVAIQQRPLLVEAQLRTELEIMDIEHAAEFYNWNAAKGYRAFRMLRDARIRRRKYKDAIRWIDTLIEANPTPFIQANVAHKINEGQQRSYHPRVFPELFTEAKT